MDSFHTGVPSPHSGPEQIVPQMFQHPECGWERNLLLSSGSGGLFIEKISKLDGWLREGLLATQNTPESLDFLSPGP